MTLEVSAYHAPRIPGVSLEEYEISGEVVSRIAKLSRVELSAAETEPVSRDFRKILDAFGALRSAPASGAPEPLSMRGRNDLREDAARPGEFWEAALRLAPSSHEGFYRVPAVLPV